MKTLIAYLTFSITALVTHQVYAVTYEDESSSIQEILLLAENGKEIRTDVQSGDLIIPGATEKPEREKKCVTVCDEWGKDCIINPSTGVRKCRRMCKAFGQECI